MLNSVGCQGVESWTVKSQVTGWGLKFAPGQTF